ncbi:GntP family permease [Microcella alkalica]|uniref:GntP family gluconate:H+ symporter n=1 Tax=Microcella alkalica TaxID=355930 RepID=A0A839ED20_9MICO|nr:GntP family permease [Microcella alkalica]MBA8848342.1 GntP family gluconate:H+ symporter [Microcella alkalica]
MIDVLILVVLIAAIVVATARFRLHPFLALLAAAFIGAFALRLAPLDVVPTITEAFGRTLGNIGIVILFGTIIGVILERTGAALSMAEAIIRVIGHRFPGLTMTIIGYIVSIPVFCDSGFVILNSLKKAVTIRAAANPVVMTIALMTGLYSTHVFVPPTPGPIAAAENYDVVDHLGLIIGLGLIVAAVSAAAGLAFAQLYRNRDLPLLPEESEDAVAANASWEELRASYGRLPSAFVAFLPILLPIVLIAIGSVAALPTTPFGEESVLTVALRLLGTPAVALAIGVIVAALTLGGSRGEKDGFADRVAEGIRVSAPILLITAAGASFGAVLAASTLDDVLGETLAGLGLGIAVPFLVAAALKSAQGSSTVALVTTSTLLYPLLPSLGLDSTIGAVLAVLATGAGAMVVSHANDSYFWVVSQFSRLPVATAYRTLTPATAVQGIAGFIAVWVLSLIML